MFTAANFTLQNIELPETRKVDRRGQARNLSGQNLVDIFAVDQGAKDAALAVLDRRAARRSALAEPVTHPPLMESDRGGCDILKPPEIAAMPPAALAEVRPELLEMVRWAKDEGAAAIADLRLTIESQFGLETWQAIAS